MTQTEQHSALVSAEATSWVTLRQVILATDDLPGDSVRLRSALGLGPGFPDPILETIGMTDEAIPVGAAHEGPAGGGSFLDLVAPLSAEGSINRWLGKMGGRGGYALAIQVPDVGPRIAAAEELGIGVIADMEVYGHRLVQFRPAGLGLLVEIDEFAEQDEWFWDDTPMTRTQDSLVDDLLGVELSCVDVADSAARLSYT